MALRDGDSDRRQEDPIIFSNYRYLVRVCLCALALGAGAPARGAAPAVSLQSLLLEMADRDAMAQWPAPAYSCRQASSHDRQKIDPVEPKGWHSNHDYEQFIRTEDNGGRHEWVIMDDTGPGAITRMWLPLNADKDKQIIRFYFDGSPTPALEANFNELLSGRGFVKPPFAFVAWNDADAPRQATNPPRDFHGVAGDLYLPIPFAKSCKVTLDQLPFYYIIDYRIYQPGTTVQTFTMADYEAQQPALDRAAPAWAATAATPGQVPLPVKALAPGLASGVDLPRGAAAVRSLTVALDPRDAPQVLRSTILEAAFDGEPTLWCPLGEFFGTGARLHAVRDWSRTVGEDGQLVARWVMPYQRSGRFTLHNVGAKPVHVSLSAVTGPWHWDDRSMHFHATWHGESGIKTRPMSDWNYLEAKGQGVYVGDTLSVYTPVAPWYGEGDERIAVDGERVPSHIGTGTEDYYGYAWGMANYFSSPFISMPLRDMPGRDNWSGYTTTSRLRLLDGIPFRTNLKHDMEIWNWADTQVDYAVGTFWYARPGARTNRTPQPQEAARTVHDAPPDPSKFTIAGVIECEAMPITGHSAGLATSIQDAGLQEGQWSGGHQLFVMATKVGDYVELEVTAPDNQPHQVTLYATRSYDYGMLRCSINGHTAGPYYDAYNATPVASGAIPLGTATPINGKLTLRVEVVGANPAARGSKYYFGLDGVVLGKP